MKLALSFLFGLALAIIMFACAFPSRVELLDSLTITPTTTTTTTTRYECIDYDPWWIPGNPVPKDSPCRRWKL